MQRERLSLHRRLMIQNKAVTNLEKGNRCRDGKGGGGALVTVFFSIYHVTSTDRAEFASARDECQRSITDE